MTADDPGVDGLLAFAKAHTSIVSTVIMKCGVVTCQTNYSTPRSHRACNNGTSGKLTGNVSAACLRAMPELASLGVRSEFWLGEDDSYASAQYLFAHPHETAADLLALAAAHPHLSGFNYDPEPGGGNATDVANLAAFLDTVTQALRPKKLRFTVDVGCNDGKQDCMTCDCKTLSRSGVDRVMNMHTYNAMSYEEWIYSRAEPATAVSPLDHLGMGLGCWIDDRTNGTWAVTAESAAQRICYAMNRSVQELAFFRLNQDATEPAKAFPEPFWIPQLERYMAGGGCELQLPKKTVCPTATVGPPDSWYAGGDAPHCCISSAARAGGSHCNKSCAQAECAATPDMHWQPENYSTHPYECCRNDGGDGDGAAAAPARRALFAPPPSLRSRRAALEVAAAGALGAAAAPAAAATPPDDELERGRVEPDWGRGRVEIVVERRKKTGEGVTKLDGSPGSNAALTALSFFGLFALGGSFGVGQKSD